MAGSWLDCCSSAHRCHAADAAPQGTLACPDRSASVEFFAAVNRRQKSRGSMLQYVLRFVAGKDQGREFPLPPDLTVVFGRVSDVDVLLLDKKVSRKHARISTHGGRIILEDLVSRYGTIFNGARVRSFEL